MTNDYAIADDAEIAFETPDSHSHFFGYYDKSPFDADGTRLLSHRVSFDGREITADDVAEVGYWRLDDREFVKIGETRAFNWQQGSMLQWLPPDYENKVIYNDRRDDSFVSVIVDIDTGSERVIPHPVYAVHPSGEYALTVNYERLYFCRPGYNYKGVVNQKWDTPIHGEDGIFRIDLADGRRRRIVSTREICETKPKPVFEAHDNWLEHIMWNPSGTRFAFFHRWRTGDGGFETRLYTANPEGNGRYMFPDTGSYSHMAWRNDEAFTIWGIEPSTHQQSVRHIRDNAVLKAIVGPAFRFLRDRVVGSEMNEILPDRAFLEFRDKHEQFDRLRPDVLDEDGHISWTPDEQWLLTDTYADDEGRRHLYLLDDETGELHELGTFASEYTGSIYRCDLHPRWDRKYDRIAVDSAHRERRQMVVLEQTLV